MILILIAIFPTACSVVVWSSIWAYSLLELFKHLCGSHLLWWRTLTFKGTFIMSEEWIFIILVFCLCYLCIPKLPSKQHWIFTEYICIKDKCKLEMKWNKYFAHTCVRTNQDRPQFIFHFHWFYYSINFSLHLL